MRHSDVEGNALQRDVPTVGGFVRSRRLFNRLVDESLPRWPKIRGSGDNVVSRVGQAAILVCG